MSLKTTNLWGIRMYKQYLKFKYGNYEQIPPVEMRKVHPVSKLELI